MYIVDSRTTKIFKKYNWCARRGDKRNHIKYSVATREPRKDEGGRDQYSSKEELESKSLQCTISNTQYTITKSLDMWRNSKT